MAHRILTLSGWGQPHDALTAVAPGATHFDYTPYATIEEALAAIAREASAHEVVIGWSLGGQLAARAVADRLIRPKKLVLIAAPFQFVAEKNDTLGMPRFTYDKFRDNYAKNPERTLKKAWELIHKDDVNSDIVRAQLEQYDPVHELEKDWLRWLALLDGFSFEGAALSHFPPTLLLHGDRDLVSSHAQSERFAKALPAAKLITYKGAGHAPHLHDTKAVRTAIEEFSRV